MPIPSSADQVLVLAPDASSAAAGRKLSSPASWSGTGVKADATAVWGLCMGSGRTPYQTVVDLSGPAFKCSCPSRKFPCKHALGLLLLWVGGGVPVGQPAEWAARWMAGRTERAAKAEKADGDPKEPVADPEASRRRAEQRSTRVAGGIDELDRWLTDQVRGGLAGVERAGYAHFETVAARMVDAQAPGLAAALRRLPGVVASGDGWPSRLLEELALLRLAVQAHRRLESLPDGLAACVRREVGYPVSKESVLAGPPVADRWDVLGQRDVEEDPLSTRRVWLRGQRTGRAAMVLSFATTGRLLDASLEPGTTVDADLHFYPGTHPLRALVGERRGDPTPMTGLPGGTVQEAAGTFAAAVAADPWTWSWPVVLAGVVPVPGEPAWHVRDHTGRAMPVLADEAHLWPLLAVSGGHPVTVTAELTVSGLRPLCVLDEGHLVPL